MSEALRVATEGPVRSLTIDQPASRNALSAGLVAELVTALAAADEDPALRCIVIAGGDEAFATGADVSAALGGAEPPSVEQLRALWSQLAALGTPTVAAVSGWALGSGCELALACDMAVASDRTQFGLPAVTLGAVPSGGAQRLARAIGRQRTMELVLTGRRFNGEQALQWGLVNRVTKRNTWFDEARALAGAVAEHGAPVAVRLAREAVLAAERLPAPEALELELELHQRTLGTRDRAEGLKALAQRRPPRFEGG